MKKLSILLALSLTLIMCLTLISCGGESCEHVYDGACDTVCNECGEVKGDNIAHTWQDATCKTPKTCTVCNLTDGEALGHAWQIADCDTPKTCTVCNLTDGEALGHTWQSADCDTPKTCQSCGETKGEALGHTWKNADCITPKTCTVCSITEGEALGHTWINADCDTPKTCKVCETTEGEKLPHNWEDATCVTAKTCKSCGTTEGEALGHTWINADCDTPKTCKVCETTEGEKLPHNWEDATCVTAKTCKTCGTTEGEALGHTPFEDDGDCTTDVRCSVCNEVTTAANESHTAEEDDYDCTTRVFCVNCEVVLVEAKEHVFNNFWNATDAHHWYECANDGCDANSSYGEHYGEDDGDCTTSIYCELCGWTLIYGNESHTPAEDDGDCTTPVTCTDCDTNVIEAKDHDFTGEYETDETDHWLICKNEGCTVENARGGHTGDAATCLNGKLCETCKHEYTSKDPTNHQGGSYSYTDNGDGTYTKIHECGEALEEKHTFDPVCDCGEKILITKMTIFGEDIVFDPTINAYTVASFQDKVDMNLVFHGTNLKYLSKENVLQKLQIDAGVVANFFLNELSLDYDENNDTLILNEQMSSGRDFIFNYSNDGGATWEDGCKISIKRLVGISVNDSKNGQVTTNENAIAGERVTVNISADDGYKFKSLIVKDSLGNEVPVENNQFTMPLSDVFISAIFVCENECTFIYVPNEDVTTHKKICSLCDYVEIESEAHTTNEYSYVDNGDNHERIWKCCGGSITEDHDFSTGKDCVCGADAICFTGLLFIANEEYLYDEETRTYTVIIPPDKNQANLAVELVGRNLEYLTTDNEFLKVKEIHHDFGESEYDLDYLIGACDFVLEWMGLSDGEWIEYYFSNDGGENWTKYRVEIKQSY